MQSTVYERRAPLESAPERTDCLTSIYYLFLKALNLKIPMTYVGDMPRTLVDSGWALQVIDSRELQAGDLIFLKRIDEPGLIVHVALTINPNRIFHCTRSGGYTIESIDKIFQTYEQIIKKDQLDYIDRRNTELREIHGGIYLNSVF